MMNKYTTVKLAFIMCILILLGSCKKYLSQVPDDKETIDDVFQKKTETEKYLAGVYSYIRSTSDWINDGGNGAPWEGLSDEMDITYNDCPTYSMNLGQWDRNRGSYNYWSFYYQGIRRASYFIERAPENPEIQPELLKQYIAEARALRAYFYSCIMAQYGPVIILPEKAVAPDAPISDFQFARSPYDSCVNYVVSEMNKAMADLPDVQTDTRQYARMSRAMCRAILSRMLLMAASPLFNGNTDYADFKNHDGTVLINQKYEVDKWKKAADAAKQIIDMNQYSLYEEFTNGKIDPFKSLKNVFLKDWNSEIIMARVDGDNMYSIDKCGSPYILGGWSSWGPTQQVVDDFFTSNGRTIDDPASGYSEEGFTDQETSYYAKGTSNMYVNREPRFYVDITFNLSKWINNASDNHGGNASSPLVIQLYKGGNSGQYTGRNWSRTGYVVRKMVHPDSRVGPDQIAGRTEVLYRLAEIYLNYTEALNEYDPGNSDIIKYINLIRERAGIPTYGAGNDQIPAPTSQQAWREAIRRERRVELAFENLRYFDTRRWKIAEQTDGGSFYGMDVNASNSTDFQKRVIFETRTFEKKNYLWNIIQDELNKDDNLVENPGW